MDGKTRRESLQEERQKIKTMPLKEKISYIWTYYKVIFFGLALILVVFVLCNQAMRGAKQESLLNAAFIDAISTTGNEMKDMEEEVAEVLKLDPETQCVAMDDSYYINLEEGDQMTVASQTKLMAAIRGETIDVMILPEDIYENYLTSGACQSLDQVLDEDFLKKEQERIYMDRGQEDTEDKIYALDVTDSPKLQKLYEGEGKVYLAVTVRAHNTENIQKFAEYLLSQ